MEDFLKASPLCCAMEAPGPDACLTKTREKATLYVAKNKIVKVHTSPLAFAREVFWYLTLQGTPFVPELLAFDLEKRSVAIGRGTPLAAASEDEMAIFSSLCAKGIKHNQWHARHLVRVDGTTKVIDWTLATFVAQPSYTLGFFSCEIDCPFHGSALCTACPATHPSARCTADVNYGNGSSPGDEDIKGGGDDDKDIKGGDDKDIRVAVVWRGLLKGRLGKGLHATPYMAASNAKVMQVDAFHPDLLEASTRALRQAEADLFVHGWTTDDTPPSIIHKHLEPLTPTRVALEPLTKSFASLYGPLLEDKDRIEKEAKTHPQSAYVHLTDSALQRWWSTWYTLHAGFSLIPDPVAYDMIVIHRPDMVIPENLEYRRLARDAITILMHQNPNGYADVRPGYHDWFLAGPPHLMAKVTNIYPALYDLFDAADHPENRSSHPLLRQWCEDHGIPVVSLHYTQVRKIHLVNGMPVISSVQMHDPMDCPSVAGHRVLGRTKATLTLQGPFSPPIVVNCLAYLPGIWRVHDIKQVSPGCVVLQVELSGEVDWDWVFHCLGRWKLGAERLMVKLRLEGGVQVRVL